MVSVRRLPPPTIPNSIPSQPRPSWESLNIALQPSPVSISGFSWWLRTGDSAWRWWTGGARESGLERPGRQHFRKQQAEMGHFGNTGSNNRIVQCDLPRDGVPCHKKQSVNWEGSIQLRQPAAPCKRSPNKSGSVIRISPPQSWCMVRRLLWQSSPRKDLRTYRWGHCYSCLRSQGNKYFIDRLLF